MKHQLKIPQRRRLQARPQSRTLLTYRTKTLLPASETTTAQALAITKFFENLNTRGWIYEDFAILLIYDPIEPNKSYILKEGIPKVNYIFKGTNGSMGLVTGNKYAIHLEDLDGEKLVAKIFLTNNYVLVGVREKSGTWPPTKPSMPFVQCPYDSPELFKQNWRVAGECNCTTPGQDDGSTTCWEHHDCSDGSCTHGE